ncbi:hypothetical protein BV96_02263 [Sphingomonas paucimobilis]|nr:hypothetical protein BV96_02263 [Sphingomonas paucimobilis]
MVSRAPGSAKSCLSFKMKACPKCEPRFCLQSNLTTVSLIARMPLQVGGVIFHVDAEASASCRFRESFMFSAGSGKRADRRSCTRRNIRSHSRDNADDPPDRLPNPAAWRRIPASREPISSRMERAGTARPGGCAASCRSCFSLRGRGRSPLCTRRPIRQPGTGPIMVPTGSAARADTPRRSGRLQRLSTPPTRFAFGSYPST